MSHPLNDVVYCKLAPSLIHGIGVFAIRDIPKGTTLSGGDLQYSRDDEDTLHPAIWDILRDHHALLESGDYIPNPNFEVFLQCFMNHSITPNSDGTVALRDIAQGQEITEDYTLAPLGLKARAHFTFL